MDEVLTCRVAISKLLSAEKAAWEQLNSPVAGGLALTEKRRHTHCFTFGTELPLSFFLCFERSGNGAALGG